jgi:type IV pilus biogenesis protein PilP
MSFLHRDKPFALKGQPGPKDLSPKTVKIILAGGVFLMLAGGAVYTFWDSTPPPPPPAWAAKAQTPAVPPAAGNKTEGKTAPATAAGADEQRQGEYLTSSSPETVRVTTELQAELEIQKLTAAIEREKANIRKIQNEGAPAPQIVTAPGMTIPPELSSILAAPPAGPTVISVQGLDNNITATVDAAGRKRTLKVGDSLGEGKVENISVAGIHVREGDKTRLISVDE